jgi:MYXO-CTERM domain-containing protein
MIRHASGLTLASALLASTAPVLAQNTTQPATPPRTTAPATPAPTSPPSPPATGEPPAAAIPVETAPTVVVPVPVPAPAPAPIELPADVPYPNGFADPTAPYGNDMSIQVRESEGFDWGLLGLLGLLGLFGLRRPRERYREIVRDERYEDDRPRR